MKRDEIVRLENYLRKTFHLQTIEVRQRPRKEDSAEVYMKEAVEVWKEVSGEDHALYGAAIGGLGRVYQAQGDFPRAITFY